MARLKGLAVCIEPPEEKILDSAIVGKCPICGLPVYYGDREILVIDGIGAMIHEDCAVFREMSLTDILDRLDVDHYKVTAAGIVKEGF